MATAITIDKEKMLENLLGAIDLSYDEVDKNEVKLTEISNNKEFADKLDNRFYAGLNLLMANYKTPEGTVVKGFNTQMTQSVINKIDTIINEQVNTIIKCKEFNNLESNWLGIKDVIDNTNFQSNIKIDLFDVTKDELTTDFECNSVDVTGSEFFKKTYLSEYDQYGGEPYGSFIGLYDFDHSTEDIDFLSTMGKMSSVNHAPFNGSLSPAFFGMDKFEDLLEIKDLNKFMNHPRYRRWKKLRDSREAVYLGLSMPRYMIREPWEKEINPAGKEFKSFNEEINPEDDNSFVWAHSSLLFARNLTRSFEETGWCQWIRGPKGGGQIDELPSYEFNTRGKDELKVPVEITLPDNKELALAKAGIIPLIQEKNTSNACFFSTQSLKLSKDFEDPADREDSQLVTNLSYTFSICRIAHYFKVIGRLNIGSTADNEYLQKIFTSWINGYVTTVIDPNDATLRRFPFKAASVNVEPVE
ncbi:MAG TPA: type VI secretion system contractile sheath large subunit [Victivallales bacterium]|nr:type VI secretion system contractile sheath large subunit [Victivallales bacterium]